MLRRVLKIPRGLAADLVGSLISTVFPGYQKRVLSKWPGCGERSAWEHFIFSVVVRRVMHEYYSPVTSTSRRETLKNLCMGEESGVAWAEYYANVGFPTKDTAKVAMFSFLEECLSAGHVKTVHEVACGSGRMAAYFAQQHPEVKFVGSDKNDRVVAACRKRWQHIPNLSFVVVHLDRLNTLEQEALRSDLVYASGGLLYLDEHSLRRLLHVLFSLTGRFLLTQPLAIDYPMEEYSHSIPRGNFTWDHPYTHFLRDEGWRDVYYEIAVTDKKKKGRAKQVSVSGLAIPRTSVSQGALM